jgi:hypothetical protein
MISVFAGWYYKQIPSRAFNYLKVWLFHLYDLFSVEIILKTYFAPWKRDIVSTKGLSLNNKIQVWWMNLVSRMVGAFIKTATLFAFLVSFVGWLVASIIFLLGWLIFPILFLVALIGVTKFL